MCIRDRLYSAVTGFKITFREYRESLKRIILLTRYFNEREGLDRRSDMLPRRFFREPIRVDRETRNLDEEKFTKALDMYYEMRGLTKDGKLRDQYKREIEELLGG